MGCYAFHMLTGTELISFVKENDEMNQMELARGAGYVRITKTGREQVLVKKFYNELLAAKGMPIAVGKTPGKSALYETSVHRSGVILLGKTYSEKFGLKPGDGLRIDVEDECIKLVPLPVAPSLVDSGVTVRKVAA
jgi:hypothetical protein